MTGYIILAVVAVAFLALAVWALTLGRKYQYPKGKWVEVTAYGVRLRVIYHPELEGMPSLELARSCAWYTDAAATAWIERWDVGAAKVAKTVEHVTVYIRPESFAGACQCGGIQGWVFRAIGGSDIPLVSLPETSTDHRLPAFIVHEVLHAIRAKVKGGADPLHTDRAVWVDVENRGKALARGPRA